MHRFDQYYIVHYVLKDVHLLMANMTIVYVREKSGALSDDEIIMRTY